MTVFKRELVERDIRGTKEHRSKRKRHRREEVPKTISLSLYSG